MTERKLLNIDLDSTSYANLNGIVVCHPAYGFVVEFDWDHENECNFPIWSAFAGMFELNGRFRLRPLSVVGAEWNEDALVRLVNDVIRSMPDHEREFVTLHFMYKSRVLIPKRMSELHLAAWPPFQRNLIRQLQYLDSTGTKLNYVIIDGQRVPLTDERNPNETVQ